MPGIFFGFFFLVLFPLMLFPIGCFIGGNVIYPLTELHWPSFRSNIKSLLHVIFGTTYAQQHLHGLMILKSKGDLFYKNLWSLARCENFSSTAGMNEALIELHHSDPGLVNEENLALLTTVSREAMEMHGEEGWSVGQLKSIVKILLLLHNANPNLNTAENRFYLSQLVPNKINNLARLANCIRPAWITQELFTQLTEGSGFSFLLANALEGLEDIGIEINQNIFNELLITDVIPTEQARTIIRRIMPDEPEIYLRPLFGRSAARQLELPIPDEPNTYAP